MLKHCTQQIDVVRQYFSVLLSFCVISDSLVSPFLNKQLRIGASVSASTRTASQINPTPPQPVVPLVRN